VRLKPCTKKPNDIGKHSYPRFNTLRFATLLGGVLKEKFLLKVAGGVGREIALLRKASKKGVLHL